MTVARQVPEPAVDALPEDLRSSRAKLVYLYLRTSGGATLAQLHDALAVPKLTLLPVLESLRERDLLERRGGRYVPAT